MINGTPEGRGVLRYSPPGTDYPEFSLCRCEVSPAHGGDAESLGKSACPRIAICTAGAGVLVSASALLRGEWRDAGFGFWGLGFLWGSLCYGEWRDAGLGVLEFFLPGQPQSTGVTRVPKKPCSD